MMSSNQSHLHPHPDQPSSILLLDDDFDTVTTLKLGLKERGFNVYSFTDPHLALEHYKTNFANYSLVISDFKMQGMNGFDFLIKVKEINPEIKVFLITSFDINSLEFQSALPSFAKLIIDEFIQKPISIGKLSIIIKKHIIRIENS